MIKDNNLVRISQADGLPVKKSTLNKWVLLTERPEIFVKLGGAVYVDLNAFDKFPRTGVWDNEGKRVKKGIA
jgi:hypothetical protein